MNEDRANIEAVDVKTTSAAARTAGNSERALSVFLDGGKVSVELAAVPERSPQHALLELILGGICNTDLELQRGYYGFRGTPGHEFVARVVDCDDPSLLNRRVVGEINLACGHCDFCDQDLSRHCRNRTVLGILGKPGAFARYFTLPKKNLHIVPDSISDRAAVFTEPLAAACEILDQISLAPGSKIAVLGDGKLGLLVTQVLLAHRFDVTLYGRHEAKLAIAEAVGASAKFAADLPTAVYACVVECTGSSQGLTSAVKMTRPRGTVVLKSTVHDAVSLDMAPVIVNEISLIGSRCGRFEPALALLDSGCVNVVPLIAAEYPLSEAPRAFAHAATKGTLKVLLRAT